MEKFPTLISQFLISSFILLFANNCGFTIANELVVEGKVGEQPSIQFSHAERGIKLICNFNEGDVKENDIPLWTFTKRGSKDVTVMNVNATCNEEKHSPKKLQLNSTESEPLIEDCEVSYNKMKLQLILEVDDIDKNEFGDYVCYPGNMSRTTNKTFSLKELVHLTRKNDEGKVQQSSVMAMVGQPLHLYCNETGLQPRIHKVSWWRAFPEEEKPVNITQELEDRTGLFENFNKTDDLHYHGLTRMEHKGNYTCQVDLKVDDAAVRDNYPIKYTFRVRIRDGNEWHLPGYVLLGECSLIALFTLVINWRENNIDEDDIAVEDSEDDDDVPDSRNKNGTKNNNRNGSK